jgi:hypothetical protein
MLTAYCRVAECRFKYSHVTKGHKCGRCRKYSHGEIECLWPYKKAGLQEYLEDTMPNNNICDVADCKYQFYHSSSAHHCPNCGLREKHTVQECISSKKQKTKNTIYNIKCPVCRIENTLINPKKIYGISNKCAICMDNVIDVVLPDCSHCCICMECLVTLHQNKTL